MWEEPQPMVAADANSGSRPNLADRRASGGILDPIQFISFIFKNLGKILMLAALFSVIGLLVFRLVPFPYQSKALVLVDPRDAPVTPGQQVVAGIGENAAFLESVLEVVLSDGFLEDVVKDLNIRSDPEFADALEDSPANDYRAAISVFRNRLKVLRLGATFVVEISFKSRDGNKAARYANAVAEAFVQSQEDGRKVATADAVDTLSLRLSKLRQKLQNSEEAVANFRNANGIVGIGQGSTLQQRELTEATQQIARAKTLVEEARARFEQVQSSSSASFNTLGDQGEATVLQSLRQQRGNLSQTLAQLNLTFGPQHPRIISERSRLVAIDDEISREHRRLVELHKKRLDAALAAQQALEQDLARLRSRASRTESALVELGDLERQAAANRQIYEDFLSRFKETDGQKGLERSEAKLVSAATPPLKTTRPSMVLAGGVIGVISLFLSTVLVILLEAWRGRPMMRPIEGFEMPLNDHGTKELQPEVQGAVQDGGLEISNPQPNDQWTSETPAQTKVSPAQRRKVNTLRSETLEEDAPTTPTAPKPINLKPDVLLPEISDELTGVKSDLETEIAWYLDEGDSVLPHLNKGASNVVLVTSCSIEEGKSTVAMAIAHLANRRGYEPVLIISQANAEIQQSNLVSNELQKYPVINPLAEDLAEWSLNLSSVRELMSLIARCRETHGYVVIDCATLHEENLSPAIVEACDQIVLVGDRRATDRSTLQTALKRLNNAGAKSIKLIANKEAF